MKKKQKKSRCILVLVLYAKIMFIKTVLTNDEENDDHQKLLCGEEHVQGSTNVEIRCTYMY